MIHNTWESFEIYASSISHELDLLHLRFQWERAVEVDAQLFSRWKWRSVENYCGGGRLIASTPHQKKKNHPPTRQKKGKILLTRKKKEEKISHTPEKLATTPLGEIITQPSGLLNQLSESHDVVVFVLFCRLLSSFVDLHWVAYRALQFYYHPNKTDEFSEKRQKCVCSLWRDC